MIRKYSTWLIVCLIFVVLLGLFVLIPNAPIWFFGESVKPERVISFIGIACGGIILLLQLNESNRRNKITERGQVDTRFKDAALLLSSNETSTIISGIYALHRIAEETHNGDKSQQGYVRIINDILCAYVREGTAIKNVSDSERTEKICTRPTIIIQTIMDVLFANQEDIYGTYISDLSDSAIMNIDFSVSRINNVKLNRSRIKDSIFDKSIINDTELHESHITGGRFNDTIINNCMIEHAKIVSTRLNKARLYNTSFSYTVFSDIITADTKIISSKFTHSHIHRSNMTQTYINDSTFNMARIENCKSTDSLFMEVNFALAWILKSEFMGSFFKQNCSFEKANISSTSFINADIDSTTIFKNVQMDDDTIFDANFDSSLLRQLDKAPNVISPE